jgi:hypothetical protein
VAKVTAAYIGAYFSVTIDEKPNEAGAPVAVLAWRILIDGVTIAECPVDGRPYLTDDGREMFLPEAEPH